MATFWRLLEQSVIVQALVTLALTGSVVYLAVTGQEIPTALLNMSLVSLGYYFGSKAQLSATTAADHVVKQFVKAQEE